MVLGKEGDNKQSDSSVGSYAWLLLLDCCLQCNAWKQLGSRNKRFQEVQEVQLAGYSIIYVSTQSQHTAQHRPQTQPLCCAAEKDASKKPPSRLIQRVFPRAVYTRRPAILGASVSAWQVDESGKGKHGACYREFLVAIGMDIGPVCRRRSKKPI